MSMYNMLFGKNPMSDIVLKALNISESDVPRFRDAYYDSKRGWLVIHTRTGGGNRDAYELGGEDQEEWNPSGPFNDDLRALPGFVKDLDDDYDRTYADFFFKPTDEWKKLLDQLSTIASEEKPAEKWQTLLRDLECGERTESTERVLALGAQIADALATNTQG